MKKQKDTQQETLGILDRIDSDLELKGEKNRSSIYSKGKFLDYQIS